MLGCGYALLNNESNAKGVVRQTLGGAIMTAGLYLWAPSGLRRLWLE